jgi:RND family efflux transporter MFP subunit
MKRLLKFGTTLVLFAVLVCCGAGGTDSKGKQKTQAAKSPPASGKSLPVKAVQAQKSPTVYHLKFPGVIQANVESNLSFRVPGLIVELPIHIGDAVRKGDLIARLDRSDYESAVDQAKADRARALARKKDAEAHYDRLRKLWADQDVSADRLDAARASARAAEDELGVAIQRLAEARRRLEHATLTAPYDGIIADKQVHVFQRVAPGQAVALLVDPSSTRLRAQLPTSLLSQKPHFAAYQCTIPGLGDLTLQATLQGIGPSALPPIRTFPITVALTPPRGTVLLPGTEGILNITVKDPHAPDYALVPASAVVGNSKGESHVWTVDRKSGKAQPHRVAIEGLHNGKIALKSGLQAGEWVITAGQNRLSPGLAVHIVQPAARNG